MLDLNQPQVGYEPTLIPDHTGVAEDIGIEPNVHARFWRPAASISYDACFCTPREIRTPTLSLRRALYFHYTKGAFCCILGEIRTPILWSVAIGSHPLNYEDMLCV